MLWSNSGLNSVSHKNCILSSKLFANLTSKWLKSEYKFLLSLLTSSSHVTQVNSSLLLHLVSLSSKGDKESNWVRSSSLSDYTGIKLNSNSASVNILPTLTNLPYTQPTGKARVWNNPQIIASVGSSNSSCLLTAKSKGLRVGLSSTGLSHTTSLGSLNGPALGSW